MEKIFNSEKELKRAYPQYAKKIQARMGVLKTAMHLGRVPTLPPDRCHQLSGQRAGTFAVDLTQPYRLIFEPAEDSVPVKEDGSIDLEKVTRIRILSVEDYH